MRWLLVAAFVKALARGNFRQAGLNANPIHLRLSFDRWDQENLVIRSSGFVRDSQHRWSTRRIDMWEG